jgi:hypothetical protein
MVARDRLLHEAIRIYDCGICHSELRQPLLSPPAQTQPPAAATCTLCAASPFSCSLCGDGVCQNHLETTAKYQEHLSGDLLRFLQAPHGDQIFCGRCFRNVLERAQRQGHSYAKRKSFFSWPLILILVALVLLFAGAGRSCPAASGLAKPRGVNPP